MIRQYLLLLSLALSLGFFSCSQGDNASGEAKKVFRYNQTGGLTSLDPAFTRNRANIWGTTQLYNGLMALNENLDPVPELAEEYSISDDGKVYTFHIKQGVNFHDNPCFQASSGKGRRLVAEDFVYSFKRVLDPKTASTGQWIFSDKVLKDAKDKTKISDTCFVAVNDTILKIYLEEPSPIFLQIVSMPYAFVVPKEAVEMYKEDFGKNPVGTGAFMFKDWQDRSSLNLVKNPGYWKKDTKGVQLPYLDAVKVSFIENENQAFLEFSDGKLEFFSGITAQSRDQILNKDGTEKDAFKGKFIVKKVDYLNTEYVGFFMEGNDPKTNPLLNKKIRQALSYAIDRESLVNFIRNKVGTPGNYGFVPKALPSFDTSRVKGYPFNKKQAQILLREGLEEIGLQKMPTLTLNTYTSDKDIAEFLQKRWKDIEVDVEIKPNQFSTHQQIVDEGKAKMFRGSWLGDYPDAENYLRLFYGVENNISPKGPNKTRYKNAEYDKLFESALQQKDLFERYDTYRKMDSMMIAEAPVLVLFYDEVIHLRQNYVKNLEPNRMNNLVLENVDIDLALKAKK